MLFRCYFLITYLRSSKISAIKSPYLIFPFRYITVIHIITSLFSTIKGPVHLDPGLGNPDRFLGSWFNLVICGKTPVIYTSKNMLVCFRFVEYDRSRNPIDLPNILQQETNFEINNVIVSLHCVLSELTSSC